MVSSRGLVSGGGFGGGRPSKHEQLLEQSLATECAKTQQQLDVIEHRLQEDLQATLWAEKEVARCSEALTKFHKARGSNQDSHFGPERAEEGTLLRDELCRLDQQISVLQLEHDTTLEAFSSIQQELETVVLRLEGLMQRSHQVVTALPRAGQHESGSDAAIPPSDDSVTASGAQGRGSMRADGALKATLATQEEQLGEQVAKLATAKREAEEIEREKEKRDEELRRMTEELSASALKQRTLSQKIEKFAKQGQKLSVAAAQAAASIKDLHKQCPDANANSSAKDSNHRHVAACEDPHKYRGIEEIEKAAASVAKLQKQAGEQEASLVGLIAQKAELGNHQVLECVGGMRE
eukprot:gene30712-35740_t